METKKHASYSQLATLVDYFQQHNGLATNKIDNVQGRNSAEKLWLELTERLNAMGGATKSVDKWKQTWRDLKSNTKKKAARVKRASGISGGPSTEPPLTELEEKVLTMLGSEPVYKIQGICETVISNDQDPSDEVTTDSTEAQKSDVTTVVDNIEPVHRQTPIEFLPQYSVSVESVRVQPGRFKRKLNVRRELTVRELVNIEKEKLEIKRQKLEMERESLAIMKNYKQKKLEALNRIAVAIEKLDN